MPFLEAQDRFRLVSKTNGVLFQILIFQNDYIIIGTIAVISISCRDVVEQILGVGDIVDGDADLGNETFPHENIQSQINSALFNSITYENTPSATEILTSLCLLVGLIQVNL